MTDEEQQQEPDEAGGTLVLMSVAAMLLQGGERTRDKRVLKLAGDVVEMLKKANALEMLLIAQAQQQTNASPGDMMPSQLAAQRRADQQQQQVNWTEVLKAIGVGK